MSSKKQTQNIFNRSQLQSALKTLYSTAIKYNPHEEIILKNCAYYLNDLIDSSVPLTKNNINAPDEDRFDTVVITIPESSPPLKRQIAMPFDQRSQEEQVPCRKPRYQFDYKIHLAIKKDMWIQRMQWVSKNMLIEKIPYDLLGAIYEQQDHTQYVSNSKGAKVYREYFEWISKNLIDSYNEFKSKPEEFHKKILKEAKSDQFHYVNNVYKMDDIPLTEIPKEEIKPEDNWATWKRAVYPHSPKSNKEFF